MGFLEDMFSASNLQQQSQRFSPLGSFGQGFLGGALAGNGLTNPYPIKKPRETIPLTFIQTLRNEIDEWLKL